MTHNPIDSHMNNFYIAHVNDEKISIHTKRRFNKKIFCAMINNYFKFDNKSDKNEGKIY